MPLEYDNWYKLDNISALNDSAYLDTCEANCLADENCNSFYTIKPVDGSYNRFCYYMNRSSQTQRLIESTGFEYHECKLDEGQN